MTGPWWSTASQEPRHDRLAHGLRLRPQPVVAAMTKLHQFGIMSAPTTSQYAAIEAMRSGDDDIAHMREEYDSRRRYLVENLNRIGLDCFEPRGLLCSLHPLQRPGALRSSASASSGREVAVIPVPPSDPGEGYVRPATPPPCGTSRSPSAAWTTSFRTCGASRREQ